MSTFRYRPHVGRHSPQMRVLKQTDGYQIQRLLPQTGLANNRISQKLVFLAFTEILVAVTLYFVWMLPFVTSYSLGRNVLKRFFDSFWPTALFILVVLLASFSAELLSPLYPQWVFVSFSFIILTLGRYILTAMMGQRVSIDKHISTIDGVKYASLINKDFVNVLEVKIFFELYENRKEILDPSKLFLIRSDSVAISSISATPKKAKTNTIHIPVPEPILKLWNEKKSSETTVFLKLGVTSVHYLTGYRRLYTETIA